MSFKGFLFFAPVANFFSVVLRNHSSNFRKRSSKEHFCEIILKSDNWSRRRMSFKGFSIFSSGGHFVQRSGTIIAILVEGHPRNISVKLF